MANLINCLICLPMIEINIPVFFQLHFDLLCYSEKKKYLKCAVIYLYVFVNIMMGWSLMCNFKSKNH